MEWVLKSNISLQALVQNFPFIFSGNNNSYNSSWAVTSKYKEHVEEQAGGAQAGFEWDSDDGAVLETKDDDDGTYTTTNGYHFLDSIPTKRLPSSGYHARE
jgi:hypothetical protein